MTPLHRFLFSRLRRAKFLRLGLVVLALPGCNTRLPEPVGAPVPDPEAAAAQLRRATTPATPRRATFAWALDESGTRLRGRGVARFEAPERLRLDLFGPRGETYLAAALVGDSFRVPPGAAERIALPSPALLWGALGVLRPPTGARLVSATENEQDRILRYETAQGETFQYRISQTPASTRLEQVERLGRSGVLESIQLSYADPGNLQQARYRDWAAYRELTLNPEEIVDASPFPTDIWDPTGAAR